MINDLSAITELQSPGTHVGDAGLQQRKSADTRTAVLDATVECLARHGYANTTTKEIARIAGISRGAMLHHYATRQQLIKAVTDHAFYRHMERFVKSVSELSEEQRMQDNAGILIDWQLYLSREYCAYLELMVAARTDDELRAMFVPKAQRHDRVWQEQLTRVFPEWSSDRERLVRSRKLVQAIMSGMVLNREVWDDPAAENSILGLLANVLLDLREGRLNWPT